MIYINIINIFGLTRWYTYISIINIAAARRLGHCVHVKNVQVERTCATNTVNQHIYGIYIYIYILYEYNRRQTTRTSRRRRGCPSRANLCNRWFVCIYMVYIRIINTIAASIYMDQRGVDGAAAGGFGHCVDVKDVQTKRTWQ